MKGLNEFAVPKYLMRVLRSYLSDRMLIYNTLQGKKSRKVTAGAAQGSILGPDLWNISYDGILRLKLVDGCFMIGYADEIALVIFARNVQQAQDSLRICMLQTSVWREERGLSLAVAKTEIVMFTRRRISNLNPIRFDEGTIIQTKDAKSIWV